MVRAKVTNNNLSEEEKYEYIRTGGPLKYYNRRRVRKRFAKQKEVRTYEPITAEWYLNLTEDLRRRRLELNIPQQKLASMLDTSQPVISRFETGKANLTIELLDRMATALKLKIIIATRPEV